ncbi:hypothetical protein F5887DRAFT_965590 [Amanita rubescens]|nr:hypothetical protein F5887DRAFT_965590 [Amanita rubescens]
MSAYGDLKVPSSGRILPTMNWPTKSPTTYITTIHLTLSTARQSPGLVEYLNMVFVKVVEDGRTYPQEGDMSGEAFEKYFFAADEAQTNGEATLKDLRAGRSWEDCVAGFYYIKPNYPGRSSHICNAGFVVPDIHRGAGFGSILANSYLYYAPRLGYQASIFNLVYVNNVASSQVS